MNKIQLVSDFISSKKPGLSLEKIAQKGLKVQTDINNVVGANGKKVGEALAKAGGAFTKLANAAAPVIEGAATAGVGLLTGSAAMLANNAANKFFGKAKFAASHKSERKLNEMILKSLGVNSYLTLLELRRIIKDPSRAIVKIQTLSVPFLDDPVSVSGFAKDLNYDVRSTITNIITDAFKTASILGDHDKLLRVALTTPKVIGEFDNYDDKDFFARFTDNFLLDYLVPDCYLSLNDIEALFSYQKFMEA